MKWNWLRRASPSCRPGPRMPPKLRLKRPLMAHRGWHPKTRAAGNCGGERAFASGPAPVISNVVVYATPSVHTRPTVRLLTPHDTVVEPPEGDMEVSNSEEDILPDIQPPLFEVILPSVLSRKTRLRWKLLGQTTTEYFCTVVAKTTLSQRALGSIAKYARFRNSSIKNLNEINKRGLRWYKIIINK